MQDDELKWWHLALCQGMNDAKPDAVPHEHTDVFFEGYEEDPVLAVTMDSICRACPVRLMCLREGVDNNESGLWGGVYLVNGRADAGKNAHKTEEQWDEIKELLAG